mmetsp:Transcript_137378/g.238953  ORF Transcript_137378/g.238953 Transcript_137378/m.238953 type:complete len:201 (-) Transcript_137378:319-921(-)
MVVSDCSTPLPPIFQCTDSLYVYGGASGSARRGKIRGWKNSQGVVVVNIPLWEMLIVELDRPGRIVQWVKIPSHVGIQGNVEADRLANIKRKSSPLYPKNARTGPAADCTFQSPCKKRKANIEHDPPDSPFLSFVDSHLLLDTLGLVPVSGPSISASDSGSDTNLTNDQSSIASDTAYPLTLVMPPPVEALPPPKPHHAL